VLLVLNRIEYSCFLLVVPPVSLVEWMSDCVVLLNEAEEESIFRHHPFCFYSNDSLPTMDMESDFQLPSDLVFIHDSDIASISSLASNNVTALHCSLSKTLYIPYYLLTSFRSDIKQALATLSTPWMSVRLEPKVLLLENECQTRTFLALSVPDETGHLASIQRAIDEVLKRYCLPLFYQPSLFHVSFAWSAAPFSAMDTSKIKVLADNSLKTFPTPIHSYQINKVYLRTGNQHVEMMLS
jgi:Uncharacterised conserved protein